MEVFAKRLMAVLAALLIFLYVGYQIVLVAFSPVSLLSAESVSEYEFITADALIFRNESLIPAPSDGFVYYRSENGSRVAKNQVVADVYPSEDLAESRSQLIQVESLISDLQAIQNQRKSGRVSLSMLNTQLREQQSEIISLFSAPNLYGLETSCEALLSTFNKQLITVGKVTDFSERLAELESRRASLAQSANSNAVSSVSSPVAGYFVNRTDGFEQSLTTEIASSLSPKEIEDLLQQEASPNPGSIGKVAGGFDWVFVCVVPAQKMTQMSIGSDVTVRFPFVSPDTIPATIVAENRDESGNLSVVFRCTAMSAELSTIRKEKVQILMTEHTGLKVPDEAVHFNDEGEAGVYVKTGDILLFKRISVIYHSETEDYSLCAPTDDRAFLQLYDDMVTEGKNLYDGKIVHG